MVSHTWGKCKQQAVETSIQMTKTYNNGATKITLQFSTCNYSSLIKILFNLVILMQQELAANPPGLNM